LLGWLVGWPNQPNNQPTNESLGWLIGWFAGCSIILSIGWLMNSWVCWRVDQPTNQASNQPIDVDSI
jgi:hypothetical protein